MRRLALVALILTVAALLAAMLLIPNGGSHRAVVVPIRSEATTTTLGGVTIQVCPPLCGEPETTTTTVAPCTIHPCPGEVGQPGGPGAVPVTVPDTQSPAPAPTDPPQQVASPGATGARSYAWWYALAICETGNNPPTDEWRTGYFGLEGGQPEGGRGWDAELAEAVSIYANYGDSAWGCAPVAWGAVPGG